MRVKKKPSQHRNSTVSIYLTKKSDWPKIHAHQLPPMLQKRVERYRHQDDQQRSAIAYYILDLMQPHAHHYSNAWNRPCTLEGDFNISHSGDLIAVAISNTGGGIGIDIEGEKSILSESALSPFLSVQECKSLAALREGDQFKNHMLSLWTKKEAFIKAIGCGWNFNWDSVRQQSPISPACTLTRVTNSDYYLTQNLGHFKHGHLSFCCKIMPQEKYRLHIVNTFSVVPKQTALPFMNNSGPSLAISPIHLPIN